ncbi:2-dehydro-3-deoxygalactonokinase [Citreicella sp. C3M06]|uniref:2-dehydro-3-deoxygalactonokinase n=1 Tax=Citreicella sp. C3M06 TaxID=2841564 RepID=UPI001C09F9D3|nr:2-dehydro-3-deoxygalactonokinase [Citreicella sp. C3M06]MBU2962523.1 2-dehydro-3-deoxygalactonokinase [Citreicella sp. C3M06]
MTQADWIAVEITPDRMLTWQMRGPDVLARHDAAPEPVSELGAELPDLPVLLSGARGHEAQVPCAIPAPLRSGRFHLLPGVRQAQPFDDMGFEATRIAGFLALNPGFDGALCLPGAVTRWVQISAGEIVSFRSFLTGTMLRLLQAPEALGVLDDALDPETLRAAVDRAMGRPAALTGDLAGLRARLMAGQGGAARSEALGWLIGVELSAAKPWWLGQNVALIGDSAAHRIALEAQGLPVLVADGARMALEGLKRAYAGLEAAT